MQIDLHQLPQTLQACPQFDLLYSLCCDAEAYLVGGAVRDALLGNSITDLDLISPSDPTPLGQEFARRAGGSWFWLDKERGQSRVVVKRSDASLCFDFAPFRAETLEGDLRDRDFTINAIALKLSEFLHPSLIDPLGGLQCLRENRLRMASDHAFGDDPLRILKGVRHATVLGLEIEASTLVSMRQHASSLDKVSPERVRQETWQILASRDAAKGLLSLEQCGAGEILFGPGYVPSFFEVVRQLPQYDSRWMALAAACPEMLRWLEEEIEQGLTRRTLLLFTFLTQQIDRALPGQIAASWLLSRRAKANITALALLDDATCAEFRSIARSPRAFSWWAQRCGVEPRLLLLYLPVCNLSNQSLMEDVRSWMPLAGQIDDHRLPDLVYGRWLAETLHIEEGPEMSRALTLLRNAEISGEVSNAEEARQFLSQLYLDND